MIATVGLIIAGASLAVLAAVAVWSCLRKKSLEIDATLDELLDSDPDDESEGADDEPDPDPDPVPERRPALTPAQVLAMTPGQIAALCEPLDWPVHPALRRKPRPRYGPNYWDAVDRQILSNPHKPYPPAEEK